MKIIIITERNHESQNKKLSTRNDKYLDLKHEIMEVKVENLANNRILKAEKDAKTADKLDNSEYLKINQKMLLNENQDIEMENQVPKDLEKQTDEYPNEEQYVGNQLPLRNPAQSTPTRPSRVIPPMPSEETMRHSIADNLMEILVNMTNPQHRQQCFSLLQVGDALQARSRILCLLQQIDERRRTRN